MSKERDSYEAKRRAAYREASELDEITALQRQVKAMRSARRAASTILGLILATFCLVGAWVGTVLGCLTALWIWSLL